MKAFLFLGSICGMPQKAARDVANKNNKNPNFVLILKQN